MSFDLGHIYATLGLDTTELNRNAAAAEGRLSAMSSTIGGVQKRLIQLGVAAAVAGAGIVAALVKTGSEAIDAQNDLARSLGTNVNALRTLQIAAAEAGVDSDTLNDSLMKMNSRLGEATTGTGKTYEALQRLGLSASALSAMDADDRMAAIADKVRELGLSSAETANLIRDLGVRGGAMVDMLRQGGDSIRDATRAMKDFGLELSDVDVSMIDQARESMARMKLVVEGIRNSVTVFLLPVLGELADRLTDAAKSSGGFGAMAVEALRSVAKGIAFVGNVWHGLHIAFKAGEVAFKSVAGGMGTVTELLANIFAAFADAAIGDINLIIRAMNKLGAGIDELPLVSESGFMKSLRDSAEQARESTGQAIMELQQLAREELPTEEVDAFFDAVEKRRKAMAEAELTGRNTAGGGGETAVADPNIAKELEAKKASLAQQLDAVREYGMSESQLLNKQLQDRMNLIREAVALRAVTEADGMALVASTAAKYVEEEKARDAASLQSSLDLHAAKQEAARQAYEQEQSFAMSDEASEIAEYERATQRVIDFYGGIAEITADGQQRLAELEQEHTDRLLSIREGAMDTLAGFTKASYGMQAKYVSEQMANMTAGVARESKAMFEINKAAGIVNAVISAYEGISKTLAAYPYPVSIAMAALQAAAAFAQVKAIASAKFGDKGGGAPSLAGGTPAPPVTPVSGGTPASAGGRLVVEGIDPGAMFSGRQMRDLAERLLEYQRDGGTVVIHG